MDLELHGVSVGIECACIFFQATYGDCTDRRLKCMPGALVFPVRACLSLKRGGARIGNTSALGPGAQAATRADGGERAAAGAAAQRRAARHLAVGAAPDVPPVQRRAAAPGVWLQARQGSPAGPQTDAPSRRLRVRCPQCVMLSLARSDLARPHNGCGVCVHTASVCHAPRTQASTPLAA